MTSNKNVSIHKINSLESVSSASKIKRMLKNPFKYFYAIIFREVIYSRSKKEKQVTCKTFFDSKINIFLPSSTDIFLTGGKSHPSEIRLAKYLILNLDKGDTFVDVGAHYGYFFLLASKLVDTQGSVFAFEASPISFQILEKNKLNIANLHVFNNAISDSDSVLTFYEFPNLYSEYNTLDVSQFKDEVWFSENSPIKIKIKSIQLEKYLVKNNIFPKIIKIDVEGAEYKVLIGMKNYLLKNAPIIVMEYLSETRGNEEHNKALNLLQNLNYHPYSINMTGELLKIDDINKYFSENNIEESDNIVFKKN